MRLQGKQKGFSLVELSVVMVIIGLLVAAVAAYMNVQLEQKRVTETKDRTVNNTATLLKFATSGTRKNPDGTVMQDASGNALLETRLPCPSPLNLDIGQTGFGVESCPPLSTAAGTEVNGVHVAEAPGGNKIFIGAFPTTTLGTHGEDSKDGFRSKYLYAVTASLTSVGSVSGRDITGSIYVRTDRGVTAPNVTDAPFIMISTGRNGLDGNASDGDGENLNNDHIFNAFAGYSEGNNNEFYDDYAQFTFSQQTPASTICVSRKHVQTYDTPGTYTWRKPGDANSIVQWVEVDLTGADATAGPWPGHTIDPHNHVPAPPTSCYDRLDPQDAGINYFHYHFWSVRGGSGGSGNRAIRGSETPNTVEVVVGRGGRYNTSAAVAGPLNQRPQGYTFHDTQHPELDGTPTHFGNFIRSDGGQYGLNYNASGRLIDCLPLDQVNAEVGGTQSDRSTRVSSLAVPIYEGWHRLNTGPEEQTDFPYTDFRRVRGTDGSMRVTTYLCDSRPGP